MRFSGMDVVTTNMVLTNIDQPMEEISTIKKSVEGGMVSYMPDGDFGLLAKDESLFLLFNGATFDEKSAREYLKLWRREILHAIN